MSAHCVQALCLQRSDKPVTSPETGAVDCCEWLCGHWEYVPLTAMAIYLQEWQMLLTDEPFFQLQTQV